MVLVCCETFFSKVVPFGNVTEWYRQKIGGRTFQEWGNSNVKAPEDVSWRLVFGGCYSLLGIWWWVFGVWYLILGT